MKASTILAAATLLSAGASAHAQSAAKPLPPLNAKSARVVHSWAQCTARYQRNASRELLAMDYRTEAYAAALGALARKSGRCLYPGESLRFHGSLLFAGGLAESLYERDFAGDDADTLTARLNAAQPISARDEIEVIALCVARSKPGMVRALLATKPVAEDEKAALIALAPTLAGCIRAGEQGRISRFAMRSLFALSLYRLSAHARGQSL